MVKILFLGDIVGEPGRKAAAHLVPQLVQRHRIDLVIANSENAAGGVGVTPSVVRQLLESGIHVLTSGNHAWDKKEGIPLYDSEKRLLRPANYPTTKYYKTPGRGHMIAHSENGAKVAVVNLIGRAFMNSYDCPFQKADEILEEIKSETSIIFVDFHAETTSEKRAMGYFLDGRVSMVVGTHTHVQTSDEQILPKGTGYLTDAGMTGPHDSVIGMDREKVLERFLTKRPARYSVAKHGARLQGVIVDVDKQTGTAKAIERVNEPLD